MVVTRARRAPLGRPCGKATNTYGPGHPYRTGLSCDFTTATVRVLYPRVHEACRARLRKGFVHIRHNKPGLGACRGPLPMWVGDIQDFTWCLPALCRQGDCDGLQCYAHAAYLFACCALAQARLIVACSACAHAKLSCCMSCFRIDSIVACRAFASTALLQVVH